MYHNKIKHVVIKHSEPTKYGFSPLEGALDKLNEYFDNLDEPGVLHIISITHTTPNTSLDQKDYEVLENSNTVCELICIYEIIPIDVVSKEDFDGSQEVGIKYC